MSYLKAFIMGGVDGVITSFAIAAAASLMQEAIFTVTVVGFSSVIADGVSMGISEYLSSASEKAITSRRGNPLYLAVVCFFSFVACGTFPLVMFLVSKRKLLACGSFSLVELMILGANQTYLTKEPLLKGLTKTALLGTCAGLVAYGVAYIASNVSN
jgi:VIT1/CCC1 family predicted Fe2+/Mn2+ transporter